MDHTIVFCSRRCDTDCCKRNKKPLGLQMRNINFDYFKECKDYTKITKGENTTKSLPKVSG